MGKGNRARIQRAQDKLDNPQGAVQVKKAPKSWVNTAIILFIVAVLAVSIVLTAVYDSGSSMRGAKALKSENYTVSGTMLSYFYQSQYSTFMSQMGSMVSYLGLDTSKPLKAQECSMLSDGGTWFDYFMNSTTAYVSELLQCCEYAKANGIELDADEKAEIDTAIENLANNAFENNYSLNGYITALYGAGVKEKDLRDAMELVLLANKAAVDATDKFEAVLTEDEIVKYYDEHPESFLAADYLVQTFEATMPTYDEDDYDTTEAYEEALAKGKADYANDKATALEKAEAYAKLSGFDAFLEKLTADITARYDGYYDDDANLTEEEREAKEKSSVATELDAANVDGYAYQDPAAEDSTELAKWIFAADRKVGDIKVIEEEDEEKGTYKAHVYCVAATAAREEYTAAEMAYIMLPASESASSLQAAELKKQLVEGGIATKDAFEAFAKEKGLTSGAYMENMLKDYFGYDAVDEYLFDEARKAGDCEVINCGTDYIGVILYMGEGDVAWHAEAKNGVLSEKVSTWYEEIAKTYTVEINEKAVNKISA
ncbi:MAG: hypothetical protein IJW99_03535 [Clostridia bacterium]|nr:hypothetical protein [Clostridia bacterium]